MLEFFKSLTQFIRNVANDERIPSQDKKVLLGLVALIASPFDLIPDWIPILGQIDDIVIIALVLDYLFNVLDQDILLSHYPWGMKSFTRIRRSAKFIAAFTPTILKNRLWSYQGSPYKT